VEATVAKQDTSAAAVARVAVAVPAAVIAAGVLAAGYDLRFGLFASAFVLGWSQLVGP
jgi:hypothetical protein